MIQTWHLYAIGAVAVTAVTWMHGYGTGRSLEGQEFAEYRAKVESAQQVIEAENNRLRRAYDQISKETAEGYTTARVAHAAGAGRIRVQQCPGGGAKVPAPAATTGGAGKAATERRPDTVVDAARCEEIANRAVMDAAHILHLQSWYQSIKTEGE